MIHYRKAKKSDWTELAKFLKEIFSKPPFNEQSSLQAIKKSMDDYYRRGIAHIALDGTKIIGSIGFRVETYWEGKILFI